MPAEGCEGETQLAVVSICTHLDTAVRTRVTLITGRKTRSLGLPRELELRLRPFGQWGVVRGAPRAMACRGMESYLARGACPTMYVDEGRSGEVCAVHIVSHSFTLRVMV
jgi:hypothetical protein